MSAYKTIVGALSAVCVMVAVLVLASSAALAAEYVSSGTFGGEGSGNGQFNHPTGLAINEVAIGNVGDVYVVDTEDDRVERFSSSGEYLSKWDGAATAAGSFSFFPEKENQGIAVDNSREPLDPSTGDVYVLDFGHRIIDQFSPEGTPTGLEIKGTCPQAGPCSARAMIPFKGNLAGITVDRQGKLWVSEDGSEALDEFDSAGTFEQSISLGGRYPEPGLAVDLKGDQYVVQPNGEVLKYHAGSIAYKLSSQARSLAIDPISNKVLVDQGSDIALYGPFAEPSSSPLHVFPSEGLSSSEGIAIDGATSAVYASEFNKDRVVMFDSIKYPEVRTETSSNIGETSATLNGTIEAEGQEITACQFEYAPEFSYGYEAYSETVACKQTPAEINALSKGGTEPVAVDAELSSLSARTNYHVRLSATNTTGPSTGKGLEFYTTSVPVIAEEDAASIYSTGAVIRASLSSGGLPASYRVEYGLTSGYGSSTPEVSVGAPRFPVTIQAPINNLEPGTEYHFRVVATNALGTGVGLDSVLVTRGAGGSTSSVLPDGRVEELVSSGPGSQSVYDPSDGEGNNAAEDLTSNEPVRAADDGSAVAYTGEPPAEGGNGAFGKGQANQFVATRGATGWVTHDVTPVGTNANTNYEAFSSDLKFGLLISEVAIQSVPPAAPQGCVGLYSRLQDGSYHALFSETVMAHECGIPRFRGMTKDGSHILFGTIAAITPGSQQGPEEKSEEEKEENIYDSVDGSVHQVNVLPNGEPERTPTAFFGGPPTAGENFPDISDDISSSGSRVFWTSTVRDQEEPGKLVPEALYVRENDEMAQSPIGPDGECTDSSDACTVEIDLGEKACVEAGNCESGGGRFWGASADGTRVFFTDCKRLTANSTAVPGKQCVRVRTQSQQEGPIGSDLYEYNFATGRLTDLTVDRDGDPLGANVQGVLGISESGDYVYFVASGALASGAKARTCELATAANENESHEEEKGIVPAHRGCNLYVWHNGETGLIGPLLSRDNNLAPVIGNAAPRGDWRAGLGEHTAGVTPDGHSLVFTSTTRPTGYDSNGFREAFVYDALDKSLVCASCDPSGAPPSVGVPSDSDIGAYLPTTYDYYGATFMERAISDDGSRVFFETKQPVVPQDANGLQDVYEWEKAGAGSCALSSVKGCIYLLSGGQSSDNSYLLDTDTTGDNVFFTSREKLVPGATERISLYDARVGGGFPEVSISCTGTGCQGVPPAPPIFATPSSVTFSGVGNFPPEGKPVVKRRATSKSAKRCRRGFAKRRGKCVKVKKHSKSGSGSNGRRR